MSVYPFLENGTVNLSVKPSELMLGQSIVYAMFHVVQSVVAWHFHIYYHRNFHTQLCLARKKLQCFVI